MELLKKKDAQKWLYFHDLVRISRRIFKLVEKGFFEQKPKSTRN
jgi:hypothetical protein